MYLDSLLPKNLFSIKKVSLTFNSVNAQDGVFNAIPVSWLFFY